MCDAHSQPDAAPRRRAVAGLMLLALACSLSAMRELMQSPSLGHQKATGDDVEARSDLRFSELRKALPQSGVVGYIGEDGPSAVVEYYLAQYALAPLVVDRSPNHAFVIGNFPSSAKASSNEATQFSLVRDFGNGVMLFATRDGN
jgi:hypothetical protein